MLHRTFLPLAVSFVVFGCLCLHPISAALALAIQAAQTTTAAQNPTQTPSTPDAATPGPAVPAAGTAKKTKKVWTNEDVSDMGRPVSVVGNGKDAKAKSGSPGSADGAYISSVRKQLEKLQGEMAAADKELTTLKNFSEGEPVATSDREFHKNYNSQPIPQQITNLEMKKKDLQGKIDALLDEARKKGVEPGQLR